MATICGSLRLDENSSLRRISRSNSSLVASELATSEIARIAAYEKLSRSMRLTTTYGYESSANNHHHQQQQQQHSTRSSNRGWTSVLKEIFSYKKVERNMNVRQTTVVEAPRVAAAREANKRRSSWLPDPHRRWPVQGW